MRSHAKREDRSASAETQRLEAIRRKVRAREGKSAFTSMMENEGLEVSEVDISDVMHCDCCSEVESPRERFIRHFSAS